jgi:O-antigen/teichoic acid export membrane protein
VSWRLTVRKRLGGMSTRSRAVGVFFATSVAARALGIACQLLQVPVAMNALGAEAFGLWMTLTGIGAMIAFADFGVGQGAQNKLAEAFAASRPDRAKELWDSTLVFFAVVGLGLALVVSVLVPVLDFARIFNLTDAVVQSQARTAVAVTLGIFCLNFPLGLAQRLALSRQMGWRHNLVLAVSSVGGLAGTIGAARLGWSLPALILAAQFPLVLGNMVLLAQQLRELGWTEWRTIRFRRSTMREVCVLGSSFGVQQVQLTLFVSLPQLIISTHLGAAAVTPYNLAQRLFNLFAVVQNAFMQPLWPAYSDAKTKGDFAWIRRTLQASFGATIACSILPMAIGAAFAQPILAAWVGTDSELPAMSLLWLMFAWNALLFIGQPFGFMLAGLSELRRLTQYSIVSAILSALLMWVWVRPYGVQGVVAGMIVGFLPFLLRGSIIEAVHVLRRFPRRDHGTRGLVNPEPAVESHS